MRTALALCCLVLLVGGLAGGVIAQETPDQVIEEPRLVYEINVEENGDAIWRVEARFPTDTDVRTEAFDELATDFQEDDGEEYLSIEPYEEAVGALDGEIDRSMEIEEGNRSVNRSDGVGRLVVTFQWTNFAAAEGGTLDVGDVFQVGESRWFGRLGAQETLLIRPPLNYTVEDSTVPGGAVLMRVEGPRDLDGSEISGTFVAARPDDDGSGGGTSLAPVLGGVLGLVGGATLVFLLTGLGNPLRSEHPEEDEGLGGEAEPEVAASTDDEETISDETLLSDEERVLSLIEARDGRMKQADIVSETDWSNAKVSQLLTQMAENGQIEKLRIGRENLIRLPQDDQPDVED